MDNFTPLTAYYGEENIERGQSALHCFYFDPSTRKEMALGMAPMVCPNKVTAQAQRVKVAAVLETPKEIGGEWKATQFMVAEGALVKVFGKFRRSWNSILEMACIYIEAHPEAPHQRITMKTLNRPGLSALTEVFVEGRFDILTPDQAKAKGALIAPGGLRQFEQVNVERVFGSPKVLAKPTRKATVSQVSRVAMGEGKVVEVRTEIPAIALDLDL